MLMNRWLFLILLFVICGCVSQGKYDALLRLQEETQRNLGTERAGHKETREHLKKERAAHEETQRNLDAEIVAHESTQWDLKKERAAHEETQRNLDAEIVAHESTQWDLKKERAFHKETQWNLDAEKTFHEETRENLKKERAAHANTQQQLDIKESYLKTVSDRLIQIGAEIDDLASRYEDLKNRYEDLKKMKEPLIRDYFELGRVSLEFGILKEEAKKNEEALRLFIQARDALKKVIEHNETSEAHYQLARVYYMLARRRRADFKDACAHAKKAIVFAPGGRHEGATALKKKIANCK